jgi:hypothetical protein
VSASKFGTSKGGGGCGVGMSVLSSKATADVYIKDVYMKDVLMNTDEGDVEMKYNA